MVGVGLLTSSSMILYLLGGLLSGFLLAWLLITTAEFEREFSSFSFVVFVMKDKGWHRAFLYAFFGALMALLFALNVLVLGQQSGLVPIQLLSFFLVAAGVYDLTFRLIPVLLIIFLVMVVAVLSLFFSFPLGLKESLLGAAIVGGLVLLLYVITKRKGIGEADIFLGATIGAIFGWTKGLLVFSLGNVIGLLFVMPLIAVFGKERMKQVPLVFFLVVAIFLQWYLGYADLILKYLA